MLAIIIFLNYWIELSTLKYSHNACKQQTKPGDTADPVLR